MTERARPGGRGVAIAATLEPATVGEQGVVLVDASELPHRAKP